ncbi:MAG: glycoside hydrolase family 2 protein, partial [Roseobacter sp.]
HVINDMDQSRDLLLTVTCLRDGATPVVSGQREMTLPAHSNQELAATDLFGAFFDTTYAYRFGPPAHDVTVARLTDPESEEIVAEAFHLPGGFETRQWLAQLEFELQRVTDDLWVLSLTADKFLPSVHLRDENFRPSENWFHLGPNTHKVIHLARNQSADPAAKPSGMIYNLGRVAPVAHSAT